MKVERIEMQVLSFPENFKKLDDPKGEVLAEVKAAFPDIEERVVFVKLWKGYEAIFVWNDCIYQKHLSFIEAVNYAESSPKAQSRIEVERRAIIKGASS